MKYDVYGIGNALVDMEFAVDDEFLRRQAIAKGHMTLVDEARIASLAADLANGASSEVPIRRLSGGSAANTVFAVQAFGGSGFYCCRVAQDEVGAHFLADLAQVGVGAGGSRPARGATGRCLTLVTVDAERTMTTCLGVSAGLGPEDVDEATVASARFLYIEGYLAAAEAGCAAAVRAREIAESAQVRTSLSLSDPSMVEGFRDALTEMLGNGVHQLFCNEEEALTWASTDRLDVAIAELRDIAPFVNITLGARGSVAVRGREQALAAGYPVSPVDTTGAGDIYAGAVIHALVGGVEPIAAARFGNFAAAELVSRHGARLASAGDYAALRAAFGG